MWFHFSSDDGAAIVIFTNVVKPTHLCNLSCKYCYNDDVRDPIMRDDTLVRVIEQTFEYVKAAAPHRLVNFIWHGGEPMIPGLKFYERIIELQERHHGDVQYSNSIQTNGMYINDEWIEFFRKSRFGISISIDGPRALHDTFRVDAQGRGSFDKVFSNIKKVQEASLPLGVCVVISRSNIEHVEEIYDFLSTNKLPFNIIPMNRSGGARENFDLVGLEAEEYADAWIRMFDRWFDGDEDYVYCSDFVFKTRAILGGRPADCIGLANCSNTNISMDPVGDVFPCATLSGHEDTKYGNIVKEDLKTIMNRPAALSFRVRQVDPQCAECKWQHVCHGGCPARSYKFSGNFHQRDYYCPSLFKIYEYIEKRLNERGLQAGKRHPLHAI
jgi:uncharacterized protein